ncbi:hypothetical protein N0V90_008107 [Kalmusia sp. IMI 367209]|nr:hypothetical protein N0V90_008107 [Kalmusia sp. IMI 367209]
MAVLKYYIDPDPDTVIVLRNPCIDFALWEGGIEQASRMSPTDVIHIQAAAPTPPRSDEDEWGDWAPRKMTKKEKKRGKKDKKEKVPKSIPDDVTNDRTTTDPLSWSLPGGGETAGPLDDLSALNQTEVFAESSTDALIEHEEAQIEDEGIFYYVSSRHLMLASPWFKRALTNKGWTESGRDKKDGLFHLTAIDWDSEAFLVMLNIFHIRNRQVPRNICFLDFLAKMAVLVDYYECSEAVELYIDMWVDDLKTKIAIPAVYNRDLVLWIWISWVFDLEEQFKSATLVAIQRCTAPLCTLGLPIPSEITSE